MAVSEVITSKQMFSEPNIISSKDMFGGIVSEPVTVTIEEEIDLWAQSKLKSGEIEPVKPTFWQGIWQKAPQMAGGGFAGYVGFREAMRRLPPTLPPAAKLAIASGVAGLSGFLGGAGGKGWQQYYKQRTQPDRAPQTLKDIYIEQLWAGLEEGATEAISPGVAKGITAGVPRLFKGYFTPALKAMIPGARESSELLTRYGTHLTYGQALQSRILDMAEEVAAGSWVGGGRLHKLTTVTQPRIIRQIFDDTLDDFAKSIGRRLTPGEVGNIVLDTIRKEDKTFRVMSRAFYHHVDNVVTKAGGRSDIIDLTRLKSYAAHQLSESASIARSQTGQTVLERILKHPNEVNFKQAASIRSQLMLLERSTAATKDVAHGTLRQLIKLSDNALEAGGKKLKGDAFNLWRAANIFHREGKEKFGVKIIQGLSTRLRDNPEKFSRMIFQPHATEQIKYLKNVVDDKTWNALKYGLVQNLFEAAEDTSGTAILGIGKAGESIRPIVGTTFLNKLDGLGDDVLRLTFSNNEIKALRLIGRTAELTQSVGQMGKQGRMLVTLTQAGLVVGLATFQPTRPGAGMILIGPYVLARMATNPTTAKLLSVGLRTFPDAPNAARIMTRIVREKAKYEYREREEKRKRAEEMEVPSLRERLNLAKAGKELLDVFE